MMTTEDMNKDVTIQVRCTAEEHARWLAAAEAEDRTLSNWLRRQANDAAPSETVLVATTPTRKQDQRKREAVEKFKAATTKKGRGE